MESVVPGTFRVPNRLSPNFRGRNKELAILDDVLYPGISRDSGPRIAVIRGMGGQGKSQTALHFCFWKRARPFTTILWVDATSESSVKSALLQASDELSPAGAILHDPDAKVRYVLDYLSAHPSPWLLVFDNYDELDYRIQDYFPDGHLGAILITSRNAMTQELVTHDQAYIELQGLDEQDALELLLRVSNIADRDTHIHHAKHILGRLGYHPLAITQAGSYIKKQRLDISQFCEHYEQRKSIVLRTTAALSEYRRKLSDSDKETASNVFTTWELSFQQLERQSSQSGAEVTLLTALAYLDNTDTSEMVFKAFQADAIRESLPEVGYRCSKDTEALTAWLQFFYTENAWDSALFADAVQILSDLSLVQSWERRDDDLIHVTIHPLVQDWIKLRCSMDQREVYTVMTWLLLGFGISVQYNEETLQHDMSVSAQQEYLRHILAHMKNQEHFLPHNSSFLHSAAAMDFHFARYMCGAYMYRMLQCTICLQIFDTVVSYLKLPLDTSLHDFGTGYLTGSFYHAALSARHLGLLERAKNYLVELLQYVVAFKASSGVCSETMILKIMVVMASIALQSDELDSAETLILDALQRDFKLNGAPDTRIMKDLSSTSDLRLYLLFSQLNLKRRNFKQAEKYARMSFKRCIGRLSLSRNSDLYLEICKTLADVLTQLGNRKEAFEFYSRAYLGYTERFGSNYPSTKECERCLKDIQEQVSTPLSGGTMIEDNFGDSMRVASNDMSIRL